VILSLLSEIPQKNNGSRSINFFSLGKTALLLFKLIEKRINVKLKK